MDMLELRIILTVVTLASLISSQYGSPLQNKDIKSILALLKQKEDQIQKQTVERSESDSSSDEESANNSIYGFLKTMEVMDLINKAKQEKGKTKNRYQDGQTHEHNDDPIHRNYEVNSLSDSQRILDQLLQNKNTASLKKVKHERLTPNNLLGPISLEDDDRQEQKGILNEYSKIYVILDPLAFQSSKNKDALTHLISRILSLSSSSKEKTLQDRNKRHHYKGFKVKDNFISRRFRRDSKETYGRDSMEDDFKGKRSRNDHGGGGGGRTAIPYIRQRGDIYERDH